MVSVQQWLKLATQWSVVRRALMAGALVGSLQILINHGDALLAGELSSRRVLKMILTSLVPYMVSTFASVGAIRHRDRGEKL